MISEWRRIQWLVDVNEQYILHNMITGDIQTKTTTDWPGWSDWRAVHNMTENILNALI